TVISAKIIIMDRRHVGGRKLRDLVRTVVHEFKHVLDPTASHGPEFYTAVDRAVDYILDGVESTPPQPVRPTPATPPAPSVNQPTPPSDAEALAAALINQTKGRRFGSLGFEPDLEYRG